jgi:8-oxo-dGTP pyrophosphatase MutT (NUDIX family)
MDGFFVGVFLYNPRTREVLLQHRDMKAAVNPGKWGFFGGSSEGQETPEQTSLRELKEELSVDFQTDQLKPLRTYFNEKFQRYSHIFVIETELQKSEMKLEEGEDFDWIPLDKVLEYDTSENTRKSLEVLIEKYL